MPTSLNCSKTTREIQTIEQAASGMWLIDNVSEWLRLRALHMGRWGRNTEVDGRCLPTAPHTDAQPHSRTWQRPAPAGLELVFPSQHLLPVAEYLHTELSHLPIAQAESLGPPPIPAVPWLPHLAPQRAPPPTSHPSLSSPSPSPRPPVPVTWSVTVIPQLGS